jgi:transposase
MNKTLFPLPEPVEPEQRETARPKPRVLKPNRAQLEMRAIDLEGLLALDHVARVVWDFVEAQDLSPLYALIKSVEGGAGRATTDPRVLMALWLYATLEGVGSARALAKLTGQHDAYRWICGGVPVNYHTLSDFRVGHPELLDQLLTANVASLMAAGAVEMKRVAQDGMRVRANAGAASFRRRGTLEECLAEAEAQVAALRKELEDDPAATTRRQEEARKRAVEARKRHVAEALAQMPEAEAKKKAKEKDKARVSTTDPEARVMKMGDGGFRPAYNAQFATDTETQVIVGVDVSNSGSDADKMPPMVEQIEQRYNAVPDEYLVDGGFAAHDDIERATKLGCTVYAPVQKPKDSARDPYQPLETDSTTIAEWRMRMGTDDAKEIYKQRASTAECVNALARNRGLQRLPVRSQPKVLAVLLWYALAHNLMRAHAFATAQEADE